MKKTILATAFAMTLGSASLAVPAEAATSTACHAHKVAKKTYWTCVTPGSYCAKAAHNRYGYAKTTHKRYKCLRYANGQWRWKKA